MAEATQDFSSQMWSAASYRNRDCWAKHLTARTTSTITIEDILATYTEDCFIQVVNNAKQTVENYSGHAGVKDYFTKQRESSKGKLLNEPNVDPASVNSMIAVWKWDSSTAIEEHRQVLDTFLFTKVDVEGQDTPISKIEQHLVFVFKNSYDTVASLEIAVTPPVDLSGKPDGYHEVFSDNFETFNQDIWKHDIGKGLPNIEGGVDGWGNWERQYYTSKKENTFVKDGILTCRALKDDDGNWTSSRLTTRGSFNFNMGKVECRVRCKTGGGPFSAVWCMSEKKHDPNVSWPLCGEIDFFEYQKIWDYTPATLHFNDHFGGNGISFHDNEIVHELEDANGDPVWHTYAAEWTPEYVALLHDGKEIGRHWRPDLDPDETKRAKPTMKNWPYIKGNPFYLIINNAIDSTWGAKSPPDLKHHDLEVDYIKVYQKK